MSGGVHLDRFVFFEWLRFGSVASERCICAEALMRYALDQQGFDLRGAVTRGHRVGALLPPSIASHRAEVIAHERARPIACLLA